MLVKTRDEVSELLGQRALQRLRAMSELCGPVRYAPPPQQQHHHHHRPQGAGAASPDAAVAAAVPSSLLDPGIASVRATRRLCKPEPGFRRGYGGGGGGGGGGGVRRRRPLAPLTHAPPRGLPATCTLRGPPPSVRQPPPPPLPGPPSPSACKKVLPPLPAAAAAAMAPEGGGGGGDNPMAGGRAWVGKGAPVNERDRDAPTTDSVIMQWCMVLESAKAEQGLSGEDATLDMVEDLRVRRVRAGERRRRHSSVAVASRSHPDVQAPTPSGVEVAAVPAPAPAEAAAAIAQGSLAAPTHPQPQPHAQPRSSRVSSCVAVEEARRPSAVLSSPPPPPAPTPAPAAADGGQNTRPVTVALVVPARVDDVFAAGGGGCRRWECDGRQVAVRVLPELESTVVARLDYGDVVEEIDRKNEWVRCVAGWVRSCNPRIKAELYLKELVDHASPLEGSSLMYNELDKITERVRSLVC